MPRHQDSARHLVFCSSSMLWESREVRFALGTHNPLSREQSQSLGWFLPTAEILILFVSKKTKLNHEPAVKFACKREKGDKRFS